MLRMGLGGGLIVGSVLLLAVAGTKIAMQRISPGALIIALGMLVSRAIRPSPTDMGEYVARCSAALLSR